ncbi:MAG: DUF4388 domain-containing protein [Deltaproteobacteria bacterium]|nr:DUF4388 domain-containing protein [Deltaproteobacteria bacterium]
MTGQARIVLVDDEDDLVWSLAGGLRRARPDLDILPFTDSIEASRFLDLATHVSLLVTDIRMPKLDGLELLLRARRGRPSLPAIVMTAFPNEGIAEQVATFGTVAYLEKPFPLPRLFELVNELLRPAKGFSGAMAIEGLADLIQLCALTNTTGALRVRRGHDAGVIWFDGGDVVHAEQDELVGADACYQIVRWADGEFALERGLRPARATMAMKATELLMEALRRQDESTREIPILDAAIDLTAGANDDLAFAEFEEPSELWTPPRDADIGATPIAATPIAATPIAATGSGYRALALLDTALPPSATLAPTLIAAAGLARGATLEPIARSAPGDTALAILGYVDALQPTSTGAVVLGELDAPTGIALIERGRLCWALAARLSQRLTDLVRARCTPPLDEPEALAIYASCAADGLPLGEALVERRRLTPAELRAALKRQIATALRTLDASAEALAWAPHDGRSHDPRYTFTPGELLAELGAVIHGEARATAAAHRLAAIDAAAIACAPDASVVPVALSARAQLLRIADVIAMSQGDSAPAPPGQVWWREHDLVFVARCEPRQLPRLVDELREHGLHPTFTPLLQDA